MDFRLDDDLLALRDLAAEIFADKATPERLREVETSATRIDGALWDEVRKAGLLAAALPPEHGGLGLPGLCSVLTEQGRRVAPVPLWSAGVAALVIARHGRAELLPDLADGSIRVTLALEEFAGDTPCVASDHGRLTGTKAVVPSPWGADYVLVAADRGLFLVPAAACAWEPVETTSLDLAGTLTLDDAPAEPLGPEALDTARAVTSVALAAVQLGVAEGALRLAADYTSGRHQFGRPLATFQSLQHHLADCQIDIDAMRVTLWQAMTQPDDAKAVLVAKWWCAQAGLDVVHRVQHVHGGIGVDVDYPVHRYFLWGKQLASTLGGAGAALDDLGDVLAGEDVRS
ncbi:acyl-CoA dehydrogenase family protein [Actinokineospora sp. HUAS TT18]|uniref:acyl-CoA dehydrogenase family protein n=1 Tax=Actinokineospora sp. HUAS TT18 TaxID=3447451 RepID=UPI003F51E0BC